MFRQRLMNKAAASSIPVSTKTEYIHALNGLALPGTSHSLEITLAGSQRRCPTRAAEAALFTHDVVAVI
jgi:hypothetical protein